MLKKYFQKLGGTYMLGDSVTGGDFEDGRLKAITTRNHGDFKFEADNFILATGSLFSKGLVSDMDGVREPVFGLDVDFLSGRSQWYEKNMFDAQPYMSFGVSVGDNFNVFRNGIRVDNLYAAGAVLSGFNALKEGSGAGVSIITALHVSSLILNSYIMS